MILPCTTHPTRKENQMKKLCTKKTVVVHSGEAPWLFYAPSGENRMHAIQPSEYGVLWFPGIKYRVTVEVIGHEHRNWGGGPTLKEAQGWLKTDAKRYRNHPAEKAALLLRIAGLKEVERLKKQLDAVLTTKETK